MEKFRITLHAATYLVILALAGSFRTAQADDLAVAQGWVDAWNSHNPDAVVAVFTEDALYEDLAFGLVNHGVGEIRAFAESFFKVVPDLQIQLVNSSIKGGHGTIEWIFSGTDQGIYKTGKKFSVRGATVIEVQGTKISRNSDYYDLATMLRQFGLLPPGL
jgi:steroid delta-isomerase-like uncharacterized protein